MNQEKRKKNWKASKQKTSFCHWFMSGFVSYMGFLFFSFFFAWNERIKSTQEQQWKESCPGDCPNRKKQNKKDSGCCVSMSDICFLFWLFSSCPGQKKKIMDFFSVEFWILEALRCCCSFFGNKKKLISCLCHQHSDDDDEFFSLMLLLLFVFIECFLFGGVRLVVVDGRYFLSTWTKKKSTFSSLVKVVWFSHTHTPGQ